MAAFAFVCASASASPTFAFTAYLNGAGGHSSAGGNLSIGNIDPSKSVRIEVNPLAGPANAPVEIEDPGTSVDLPFIPGLAGGDTVSVWQPADKSEAPVEHVLQAPTIGYEDGALKGTVPAGFTAAITTDVACEREAQQFSGLTGNFEIPFSGEPGMFTTISASNGADSTILESSTAGETPCIRVNASSRPSGYTVAVTHLNGSTSETSKVVLERGGGQLAEATGDGTGVVLNSAAVPQPGDVIEFYKPASSPTPAKTVTVPSFGASFNTDSDRVSVEGPAASAIRVTPQHTIQFRLQRSVAAGSTEFDFAQPANSFPSYDIRAGDDVFAQYVDPDHTLEYYVDAADATPVVTPEDPTVIEKGAPGPVGDTTRPKIKLSLASKLELSTLLEALTKGLTVKLRSSEAGSARLTLTAGRTKLATAKATTKAGTVTVKLKFTKSGKKAVRKLKSRGRGFKSQKATLSSVVTDAAGNTSTKSKSVTIKR